MDTTTLPPETVKGTRIAAAAGLALLGAGLIFVMFVLPAEYAVDPLGTGRRLGLLQLGETGKQVEALENAAGGAAAVQALIATQERPFQHETIEFRLGPREGMEYKYRLEKGEALLYSWKTPVPVEFEFHAEPDSGPRGYAQTYEKARSGAASGTLMAPFNGIHGWYWENPTDQEITVTLSASGFYIVSHEFRTGQAVKNKNFAAP
jgi:hypothetical protein